jgi:hypothetical protein
MAPSSKIAKVDLRRSRITIVAAVLVAASGSAVALGETGDHGHAGSPPGMKLATAPRHGRQPKISQRLDQAFSVLHRSGLSAHNTSILPGLQGLSAIPDNLDVADAVVIPATYPVVIVPGETGVCLLNGPLGMTAAEAGAAGQLGGTCSSVANAEKYGLAETTESASGGPMVVGIAPNGNTSVTVTSSNDTTQRTPVTNNVYEIIGGTPATIRLKSASGASVTRSVAPISHPPASSPTGASTP